MTDDASDEDYRPWEQPGAFRLDCESHRGQMLKRLGFTSFGFSVLALCVLLTVVPGLLMAFVVWVMARRDLKKMEAGVMDPAGVKLTEDGRAFATMAMLTSIMVFMLWGLVCHRYVFGP